MISCIHKKVPLVTSDKFHHTDFRNHQFLGNYEFVQWGISGKKRDLNNWLITFGAHALLKVLNRLIKWVWSGVWRHMQMLYMGPIVHTSAWVCFQFPKFSGNEWKANFIMFMKTFLHACICGNDLLLSLSIWGSCHSATWHPFCVYIFLYVPFQQQF